MKYRTKYTQKNTDNVSGIILASIPPPTPKKPKAPKPEPKPKTTKPSLSKKDSPTVSKTQDAATTKDFPKVQPKPKPKKELPNGNTTKASTKLTNGVKAKVAEKSINIVHELEDTDGCIGDPLELTVEVSTKKLLDAQWFIDGDLIQEENGIEYVASPPKYSLKFDDLLEEDEGEYTVELRTKDDKVLKSSCILLVTEQATMPELIAPLDAVEVDSGEIAEFRVLVHSESTPNVTWLFNGNEVQSSDKYEIGQEADEYYLIINDCEKSDSGDYSIDIKNSKGKVSSSAALNVYEEEPAVDEESAPILQLPGVCQEGKVKSLEEEDLLLEIDCESKSDTTVTWTRNGIKISPSKRIEQSKDNVAVSLLIRDATKKDSGTYVCVVENAAGKSEVSFEVAITGNYTIYFHFYVVSIISIHFFVLY